MTASPPLNVTIRRAGPDDLSAATTLVDEVWSTSNSEFLPEETLAALKHENSIANVMASRCQDLWLADDSEHLAGVMGLAADGYLWALYVRPEFQRKGIARALLDAGAAVHREKGTLQLTLDLIEGNSTALDFYRSQGWIERERRPESLPGHHTTAIRFEFPL